MGSLSEADAERLVAYTDSRGVARAAAVAVDDARGEPRPAMLLTALGRSPGDLDYVYFDYARAER